MGLFTKSPEEKELILKQMLEEERITRTLKDIVLFPGSKKEFEEFIGHECDIIDVGEGYHDKFVVYQDLFLNPKSGYCRRLVDNGILALVNMNLSRAYASGTVHYGLPVGRKKINNNNYGEKVK